MTLTVLVCSAYNWNIGEYMWMARDPVCERTYARPCSDVERMAEREKSEKTIKREGSREKKQAT